MQKNGRYKGKVLSLGSEGEGVIKCGDTTAFVPFCLVGEEVTFTALKVTGSVAYGKVESVDSPSSHRVQPVCPHFYKCGGCQLQHADYATQLDFKRQSVITALKKIGGIEAEVGQTVPSPRVYGYRNKLALPVGCDSSGGVIAGFYAPRSHRIVPIDECALQQSWSAPLISSLKTFMAQSSLKGYDERTFKGEVRQLVAREVGGRLVITVVAAKRVDLAPFVNVLKQSFKDKEFTLLLNVNPSRGNVIFGDEWRTVYGDGYFFGEDAGIKFKAGANTFLQVNDGVRSALYERVVKEVADFESVALDLYSGGGMLTAMLAKACRAAYGIEIVPQAVECADELRELNGLKDKMFNLCGAVEEKLPEVFERTAGSNRVIVCDPPRKGMERSVVNAILKSGAKKLVLVSCNPATLARDLGLLCGSLIEREGAIVKNPGYIPGSINGYFNIVSLTPFDMFPQTKHVETVAVLERE